MRSLDVKRRNRTCGWSAYFWTQRTILEQGIVCVWQQNVGGLVVGEVRVYCGGFKVSFTTTWDEDDFCGYQPVYDIARAELGELAPT